MKSTDFVLDGIRIGVRLWMQALARVLLKISGGRLNPDAVTVFGLAMHVPVAYLIATDNLLWAALLLVVFGLTDALDGELARLQKTASPAGMLLDASADRIKETFLFAGIAAYFVNSGNLDGAVWAVLALGASLIVSYVKAKGETAVAGSNLSHAVVNRLFTAGLMRFEVRMGLLVIGCLGGWLYGVTIAIAVLSGYTALERLILIMRALKDPESTESFIEDYKKEQAAKAAAKK